MRSSRLRRVLLYLTAFVFVVFPVGSLAVPHKMAEGLGYTLDNVDALNEFRAIYVAVGKGASFHTAVLTDADQRGSDFHQDLQP